MITALTALGWPLYLAMGFTILTGACFQGVAGIGFALVCAPVAALYFPALIPGPLLILGLPLSTLTGLREREAIDWPLGWIALTGRVLGTALAGLCLMLLSERTLALAFAACIILAVALSTLGRKIVANRRSVAVAGIASGLMGTITSAGGPPFAIVMQHMEADRLRATLSFIFTVGTVISLAALLGMGRMDWNQVWLGILLMPWLFAGFAVSGRIARLIPAAKLRIVLLTLALFSGVGLLLTAW